jgi:hypothetical protein
MKNQQTERNSVIVHAFAALFLLLLFRSVSGTSASTEDSNIDRGYVITTQAIQKDVLSVRPVSSTTENYCISLHNFRNFIGFTETLKITSDNQQDFIRFIAIKLNDSIIPAFSCRFYYLYFSHTSGDLPDLS